MQVELEDAADAGDLADLIKAVDHQVRHHSQRSVVAARVKTEKAARASRTRQIALLCSSLVLVVGAAAFVHFGPFAVRRLSIEETSRELEKSINFGVRLVEGYRSRSGGALPMTVAAVGLNAADGWSFTATGAAQYQLSLRFGGQIGTFDSVSGFTVASEKGR